MIINKIKTLAWRVPGKTVWLLFYMICALIFISCGNGQSEPSGIPKEILNGLDNITSYEMNVVYSEFFGDDGSDNSLHSNCKTKIKYVKPNLLCMDAFGSIRSRLGGMTVNQTIQIYTTFDGKHQKARFKAEGNGQTKTNSIIMDMSINPPETPFDGWNIQGFGLLEGKDYIGTVRSLVNQYDLRKSARKNNITTFEGTVNVKRCVDMFSEAMPKQSAQRFADSVAQTHKGFSLRVDTSRKIVTGYTIKASFDKDIITRRCEFGEIKINQKINSDLFLFKALPEEEFKDVTKMLRDNRKHAEKIKKMF